MQNDPKPIRQVDGASTPEEAPPAEIIDISQPLSAETAPWPGDKGFRRTWTARIAEGSSVNIGAFGMSAHLGTHADAPLHFEDDGASTSRFPLEAFVGPACVVEVEGEAIRPAHVEALNLRSAPRVLFKTKSSDVPFSQWGDDFPPILPETIERLAERGVVLVGTDAPSVDPSDSQALPAHHVLAERGIVNLENLALAEVEPGRYGLSALPLKLEGMDAAPVRAVLMR